MARVEGSVMMTSMDERRAELDNRYAAVPVKRFPRRVMSETPEERFWRGFRKKTEIPSSFRGKVSCIDFNPTAPHNCAVTGQGKVQILHPQTHESVKEWHPPDTVYCTRWRGDGRMLVSSGEKTNIKIWTLGNMKMVRELKANLEGAKGHTRAIHTVHFLPDNKRVLSGSDDWTAVVWDVATQEQEVRLSGHTAYVRSCAPHPYDPNIVATSSYDGTVKVWDVRTDCSSPVLDFTAGESVRSVVFHPTGKYLASASGTELSIWDAAMGGQSGLASIVSNHTKDITALSFNSHGTRLFTGSVDRHVKVYETENYTTVHTMSYSEPVFAVGLSPDAGCFVAGTLEGKIYLRSRPPTEEDEEEEEAEEEQGENDTGYTPTSLAMYSGLGDMSLVRKRNWHVPFKGKAVEDEFVVESKHASRVKRYDVAFRKFNYHKALDEVLSEKKSNRDRHALFYSVICELQRRNGLRIALTGRDASELHELLCVIKECITDPRYCNTLVLVMNLVLEIYHSVLHESPEILREVTAIWKKVREQVAFLSSLQEVSGVISSLSNQSKVQRLKRERVSRVNPE